MTIDQIANTKYEPKIVVSPWARYGQSTFKSKKGINCYRFTLQFVPKNEEWRGAISIERFSNGRSAGPKWVSYLQKICEEEKIDNLDGLYEKYKEARTTHHLNLKKKYPFLVPKNFLTP